MTTRSEYLQRLLPLYRAETGKTTWENIEVAEWVIKRGVEAPKPKTAAELLAEQFAQALREEHRRDPKTGLNYRANHAYKIRRDSDGKQMVLWVELETATHGQMNMSLTNRRDGIIADCLQLRIDETVWNVRNPAGPQINKVLDFEEDINERLHSPAFLEEAA